MNESLEVFLKILSLVTIFIPILRLFIIMQNRTIVEYIILPHRTREWENFIELVLLSSLMVIGCTIPVLTITFEMSESFFNVLLLTNSFLILGAHLYVIVCWVISWFNNKIKKKSNLISNILFVDFALHLTIITLITILFKDMINKNLSEGKYNYIFILGLVTIVFVILLFCIFRDIARYFQKKDINGYKLEIIDENFINQLYFVYSIENDIQVFHSNAVNKKQLKLPAYIFYPKEKALYKIDKEKENNLHNTPDSGCRHAPLIRRRYVGKK